MKAALRVDPLSELRALVAEHGRRLVALEAAQPRDAADAALRALLPQSTRGLAFSAKQLLDHARVDPTLAAALEGADLQTAPEVGAWLRGQRSVRDGVMIVRLRNRRWRACTSDTSCAGADAVLR